ALREPLLAGACHGWRLRAERNGSGHPRRHRKPHGLAVGRCHPRHHRSGGIHLLSDGLSRCLRPRCPRRDPSLPAVGTVRKRMKLWTTVFVLLAALPLAVRSDFLLTIFIFTFIYGILAVTFDLIFGFTGQLSMFHPAVFGVSAYMTHLLAVHAGLPFWAATLPSAAASVVLAVVVGSICFKFRLKTFYFAVVTLAFSEMIRLVVMNWNSVTNGTLGLVVAGKPTIYWPGSGLVPIKGPVAWYYLTLVALSVTVLICARCLSSWMGRSFGAIRLNEDLARTLGINVFRYK